MELSNAVSGLRPGRSVFNLSHEVVTSADFGVLYPCLVKDMEPGAKFQLGNNLVIRLNPTIKPVMHDISAYIHYFFVPYRLLWEDWTKFITGDISGNDETPPPTWTPAAGENDQDTLWDYLGFPIKKDMAGCLPSDFPRLAYNKIYDDFFKDEDLVPSFDPATNTGLLKRAYRKDYFTSARPFTQRGDPAGLPIAGITNADFGDNRYSVQSAQTDATAYNPADQQITGSVAGTGIADALQIRSGPLTATNTVDLAANTFNIAQLRWAFQIQKWQERNARAGVRLKEFIMSHYGVNIGDARLDRAEFIGGSKQKIVLSEVLQTSSSAFESGPVSLTPQGNLAGHGISAATNRVGSYYAPEHGVMMAILSILPKSMYQQGLDREWNRKTRYDYYFPEFAHLSEQMVENSEIFVTDGDAATNNAEFGYQGRYDDLRHARSKVTGLMRSDADPNTEYWHGARNFSSVPILNQDFIEVDKASYDRLFALENAYQCQVRIGHIIRAIRPMPFASNPGLIDHF